jgi:hypothetical protein
VDYVIFGKRKKANRRLCMIRLNSKDQETYDKYREMILSGDREGSDIDANIVDDIMQDLIEIGYQIGSRN